MKILVLGAGGREHALTHTFYRQGHEVCCLPGNAGTGLISLPIPQEWSGIEMCQHDKLADLAEKEGFQLTVVGPEAPLSKGIADTFRNRGLPLFGPVEKAARLESSKIWAKEFMAKYEIPTAPFHICDYQSEAQDLLAGCFEEWPGIVIKPDGLTAGKGVVVCETLESARSAVKTIMEDGKYGPAGNQVILEKRLQGPEVSILAFCDGQEILPMIPSQDHKRLLDGDAGPNTGGIGAYAPLPFLDGETLETVRKEILERTLFGLKKEGIDYRGIIYFGIMLSDAGPQVLEYNCRFGDPETQAVLPLLESDLAEVMLACAEGRLEGKTLRWSNQSSCCVVLCSEGYPESFRTGFPINGLEEIENLNDVTCYHAGTKKNPDGRIFTSGGRVLGITATASDLSSAAVKAYGAAEKIDFEGIYYRKDIAHQALKTALT